MTGDKNKPKEDPAEKKSSLSQELAECFDNLPVAVFSRRGRIIQISDDAVQMLGLSSEQLIGNSLRKAHCRILDNSGNVMLSREHPWIRAGRRNTVISNAVTGIDLSDGVRRWQQSTSVPINSSSSGGRRVVTVFTDITRLRQTQVQQLQSQKMESLGAMAAAIAHDFNNILSNIRSLVQSRREGCSSVTARCHEAFNDMESQIRRGAEFVKQILLFSKPRRDRGSITRVDECVRQFQRLMKQAMPKCIRCNLHLSCDGYVIRMSPTHLDQALLNLAINARDAMPHGGSLRISTSIARYGKSLPGPVRQMKAGTYARIDVNDTGVGMDDETIAKIFDPFYTTKPEGSGLGLSILFGVVQQHKGYITVNSMRPGGTTISLFLPASEASTQRPRKKTLEPTPRGGHETILVADDERITTKSVARFLQKYGYRTFVAYNGREALDIFRQHADSINLVLLDLEMPEITGSQCLAEMLSLNPDLKAIIMSGHIIDPVNCDPVRDGAKVFVAKPYDADELLDVVRKILDGKPR